MLRNPLRRRAGSRGAADSVEAEQAAARDGRAALRLRGSQDSPHQRIWHVGSLRPWLAGAIFRSSRGKEQPQLSRPAADERAERVKEVYLSIYSQVVLSIGQLRSAPSSERTSTSLLDHLNPYLQMDMLSCLHDFKCNFSPTARCQLNAMEHHPGQPQRQFASTFPCPEWGEDRQGGHPFQETISVPSVPGSRPHPRTLNG